MSEIGRKELQGNGAVELEIQGFVDNPHPAAAEVPENLVMRYRLADHRKLVRIHAVPNTRQLGGTAQSTAGNVESQTMRERLRPGKGAGKARKDEDSKPQCFVV